MPLGGRWRRRSFSGALSPRPAIVRSAARRAATVDNGDECISPSKGRGRLREQAGVSDEVEGGGPATTGSDNELDLFPNHPSRKPSPVEARLPAGVAAAAAEEPAEPPPPSAADSFDSPGDQELAPSPASEPWLNDMNPFSYGDATSKGGDDEEGAAAEGGLQTSADPFAATVRGVNPFDEFDEGEGESEVEVEGEGEGGGEGEGEGEGEGDVNSSFDGLPTNPFEAGDESFEGHGQLSEGDADADADAAPAAAAILASPRSTIKSIMRSPLPDEGDQGITLCRSRETSADDVAGRHGEGANAAEPDLSSTARGFGGSFQSRESRGSSPAASEADASPTSESRGFGGPRQPRKSAPDSPNFASPQPFAQEPRESAPDSPNFDSPQPFAHGFAASPTSDGASDQSILEAVADGALADLLDRVPPPPPLVAVGDNEIEGAAEADATAKHATPVSEAIRMARKERLEASLEGEAQLRTGSEVGGDGGDGGGSEDEDEDGDTYGDDSFARESFVQEEAHADEQEGTDAGAAADADGVGLDDRFRESGRYVG